MSERQEMDDNKIRVIEGRRKEQEQELPSPICPEERSASKRGMRPYLFGVAVLMVACIAAFLIWYAPRACSRVHDDTVKTSSHAGTRPGQGDAQDITVQAAREARGSQAEGYTERCDTVVNGEELTLLIPHNAVPSLEVGMENINDTTAVLILQAADVRGDNGEINCAFVRRGEMLSRGERKAGYCAIIHGNVTVGVERYSPLLEQAIQDGGDFFRQYPLVAGGLPVANELKSRSLRRALVQMDGKILVVMTRKRMSLDDFASVLVSLGAEQAIYLVGSTAAGAMRLKDGSREEFGDRQEHANINFIVWH